MAELLMHAIEQGLAYGIAALGVFFLGVWGGVELGRYLERWLQMHRGPGG